MSARFNAVTARVMADVLIFIDEMWTHTWPEGPEDTGYQPRISAETREAWRYLRETLDNCGVLRSDELPRDADGDVDDAQIARDQMHSTLAEIMRCAS